MGPTDMQRHPFAAQLALLLGLVLITHTMLAALAAPLNPYLAAVL
jgi:hypothetical protein